MLEGQTSSLCIKRILPQNKSMNKIQRIMVLDFFSKFKKCDTREKLYETK